MRSGYVWLLAAALCCCTWVVGDEVEDTVQHALDLLEMWQRHYENGLPERPFVTAAFAQSMDGFMAQYEEDTTTTSSNLALSGPESMLLTHGLRSIHDGILIGGKTLSTDNPRLTNRLWKDPESFVLKTPRPIVLDTHLNHFHNIGRDCRLRNTIVCCSAVAMSSHNDGTCVDDVELLPCQCTPDGKICVRDALEQVKRRYNIRHVMVEGGATVLSSFFRENLVDAICMTVAPKFIVSGISPVVGIGHGSVPLNLRMESFISFILGHDTTLLAQCHSS